jgi:hypothetical protein
LANCYTPLSFIFQKKKKNMEKQKKTKKNPKAYPVSVNENADAPAGRYVLGAAIGRRVVCLVVIGPRHPALGCGACCMAVRRSVQNRSGFNWSDLDLAGGNATVILFCFRCSETQTILKTHDTARDIGCNFLS